MKLVGRLYVHLARAVHRRLNTTIFFREFLQLDVALNDKGEAGARMDMPPSNPGREHASLDHKVASFPRMDHEIGQLVDLEWIERRPVRERLDLRYDISRCVKRDGNHKGHARINQSSHSKLLFVSWTLRCEE